MRYKQDNFSVEEEVRLLFDNRKINGYTEEEHKVEWVLTDSNKIPNPYIDVPLEDIPLKLKKIYLGPNMSDTETIEYQLRIMLEPFKLSDIDILPSETKNYRPKDKK